MPLDLTNTVVAGELAMSGVEDSASTGYNAESADSIAPGLFVAIAAGKEGNLERRGLVLPAAATAIVVGVAKRELFSLATGYAPKEQVAYFTKGRVGMPVTVAVKAGDPVYCGILATNKGKALNAAGAGPDGILITGARFLSTTAANGIAIVGLNMP